MITAVAVRDDQDWQGALIVLGMLALIALYSWCWSRGIFWVDEKLVLRLRAAYDAGAHVDLIEIDHTQCSNPDCDETICCCRKAAECTGCTTLGCDHGPFLCWGCRLSCRECSWEYDTEQALTIGASR